MAFVLAVMMGAAAGYAGVSLMGGARAQGVSPPQPDSTETAAYQTSRPLRGPVPDDAPFVSKDGEAPVSIPQYIPALDRNGEPAGYIHYDTWLHTQQTLEVEALPVYDDSLKHIVGRMVPDYGFVPNGMKLSELEPLNVEVRTMDEFDN